MQKRFLLIPNDSKPEAVAFAARLAQTLHEGGQWVCMAAAGVAAPAPCDAVLHGGEPRAFDVDAAVILGGDGTVLNSLHRYNLFDVPFFGVNFGHVGYLAECEPADAEAFVDAIVQDKCQLESRLVLQGSLCGAGEEMEFLALNEAVIHRGARSRALRFGVAVNGNPVYAFSGDGILVATPTGSTAYNISAGGPVLMPTSDSIVVTPICAQFHTGFPLVVPGGDRLDVTVRDVYPGANRPALDACEPVMDVDACERLTAAPGCTVSFTRSARRVRMLTLGHNTFYAALKKKLSAVGNGAL